MIDRDDFTFVKQDVGIIFWQTFMLTVILYCMITNNPNWLTLLVVPIR